MKKSILYCTISVFVFICIGCGAKESIVEMSTEEITADSVQEETDAPSLLNIPNDEYEYAEYFSSMIIWNPSALRDMVSPRYEEGKIVYDYTLTLAFEKYNGMDDGKLYAIRIEEVSDKTVEDVYYRLIKPLGVLTEYRSKSDDQICSEIQSEIDSIKQIAPTANPACDMIIFATRDQIEAFQCPEDMTVALYWEPRIEPFYISEENIKYYLGEEVYINIWGVLEKKDEICNKYNLTVENSSVSERESIGTMNVHAKVSKETALAMMRDGYEPYYDWIEME